jgi:hypothetical protein
MQWDFLNEAQIGSIMSAYQTQGSFYFIDASHGNHLPASTLWETDGGFRLGITRFLGPDGFSPAWQINENGNNVPWRATSRIPVTPGDTVVVGFSCRLLSGSTPGSVYFYSDWMDAADTQLGNSLVQAAPSSSTSWATTKVQITVPSTSTIAAARVGLYTPNAAVPVLVSQILYRLDSFSSMSISDDWVPPGGSARVVIPEAPDFATLSPTKRSASVTLQEVTT